MYHPSEVTFSALSASGVRIDWGEIRGGNGYRIRLRKVGEPSWIERRFNRTYINAVRLANCTEYEIQFATYFGESLSEFSDSYTFTTLGCEVTPKDPAGIQHLIVLR